MRLPRDRRGSILAITGMITPALIGILALGADAGVWYVGKRVLQTETDAAALSGAYERAKGNNAIAVVRAAATKEAVRNGFTNAAPNTITINNPPTTGPNAGEGSAVEVILSAPQNLLFASLFLDSLTIRTRAVAIVQTTGTACVLSLDPTASNALIASGSSILNMPGCVMAANSTSSSAIYLAGGTNVLAESLWTAGNYTTSGSPTLNFARPPTVNAWEIDDPYAGMLPPVVGSCTSHPEYKNGTFTISPGTYCDGLSIGTGSLVTFQPGTYYINRGDFDVAGSATIRCDCTGTAGVTIVLTSDGLPSTIGSVTINGGADVQLVAPSDGLSTYSGLAFYQDPRAPTDSSNTARFNGGALMSITGAVYFPNQLIEWTGNNSPSAPTCTQIVGKTVAFTGNATINNSGCLAAGVQPITITGVRIVE